MQFNRVNNKEHKYSLCGQQCLDLCNYVLCNYVLDYILNTVSSTFNFILINVSGTW